MTLLSRHWPGGLGTSESLLRHIYCIAGLSLPFAGKTDNSVIFAKDIEDGEHFEYTGAITRFAWSKKTLRRFGRLLVAERMENEQSFGSQARYLGYTVNGRTYNIPEYEVKDMPKGSADVREDWLKKQGWSVVKDLANYKTYKREATEKKDVSELSEDAEQQE